MKLTFHAFKESYIYKPKYTDMDETPVIEVKEIGFQWETDNPFLFCVHHKDAYPKGNGKLGPDGSLDGRRMGS